VLKCISPGSVTLFEDSIRAGLYPPYEEGALFGGEGKSSETKKEHLGRLRQDLDNAAIYQVRLKPEDWERPQNM
jgi:hypothetical protein